MSIQRLRCGAFLMLPFMVMISGNCNGGKSTLPLDPSSRKLLTSADIGEVRLTPQNWTDAESNEFYNVPQGSKLIPYVWFLHLEQPDSQNPFRDADHIRSLGYLPRSPDSRGNPDGLPIGFVKDGTHLGLSCAACHTQQINYEGTAWLIDGAPTLGDLEKLLRRLVRTLDQTLNDDAKFKRFAKRILGEGASDPAKADLKEQLRTVHVSRNGYNERNLPRDGAPPFGPGRVDAFGAIMNEVTTTFAKVPSNQAPADAPVSFPCLWDSPQHDRVQWNGAAQNSESRLLSLLIGTRHVGALGRNVGEVLGVFGTVDATKEGGLLKGYPSSVNKKNLIKIEDSLRKLWSPQWPPGLPPIDETLRTSGQQLFVAHCQDCHKPIQRDAANRRVVAQMKVVDTDETMASNFAVRVAKSGVMGGRVLAYPDTRRRLNPTEAVKDLLVHMAQRVVLGRFQQTDGPESRLEDLPEEMPSHLEFSVVAEVHVGDHKLMGAFNHLTFHEGKVRELVCREALHIARPDAVYRQDISNPQEVTRFVAPSGTSIGLDTLSGVRGERTPAGTRVTFETPATIRYAYKARPLNGIWATAPYLHNGSVPNLDELLKAPGKRVKTFRVGSREFDPENVGFVTTEGEFTLDTTLPGNSNAGHHYEIEFSEDQRKQLIEYMKSL